MSWLAPGARVHVVGVGGAGMSAVARLLLEAGCRVSGSDAVSSPALEELAAAGATVAVGHDAAHGADAEVVLWSPAVDARNLELVAARERGARLVTRAQLVEELARAYRVVGLAGTHGKTTATSMMVHVAAAAGRDAARLVGAPVIGVGASGHHGPDGLIMEVDESFGTFARLAPAALGLLNVEADHLDHYGTLAALEEAFTGLVGRTRGPVVVWGDDEGAMRVASASARAPEVVGEGRHASWRVSDVVVGRAGSSFTLASRDTALDVRLRVAGRHAVADAAVVAVLALADGVPASAVVAGLGAFAGAPRRFELKGAWAGVDVYEDYAHLPSEIAATLEALRAVGYRHVTALFQPHRVSRTLSLASAFAPAFDLAERVVVTDVYAAGEANPGGVTGEAVAGPLRERRGDAVRYGAGLADAAAVLEEWRGASDVIVLLGAGDVARVVGLLTGGLS